MFLFPVCPLCVRVSAWAVLMDRRQQNLQLVLLPPALFIPAHQDEAKRQESLEALGDSVHPFIIYQETSDIWINVSASNAFFIIPRVSHISAALVSQSDLIFSINPSGTETDICCEVYN